jgi:heparan-alpha-glucosaminide N-acetyltransferase
LNVTLPRLAGGRNDTVDLFRALTVLVMVVVNDWAGVAGLPAWAGHLPADADAMSFVDAVFPAFLFIVGLSIPFALQQRAGAGQPPATMLRRAAQRAGALVVLGLFMVNAEEAGSTATMALPVAAWALAAYLGTFLLWGSLRGGPALAVRWRIAGAVLLGVLALLYRDAGGATMQPHWWGILGLIGWAYLLACAVYVGARGRVPLLLAAMVLCVVWYVAAAPRLGQGGHATHTAIVLAGSVAARLLFDAERPRVMAALGFALALAAAAAALRPGWKISKIHATPSWALYSAAACIVIAVLLRAALRRAPAAGARLAAWLAPVAANPLVAYLIPFVVEALLQLAGWQRPPLLRQGAAGIATALVYALAVLAATRWLAARGVRLRL